MKILIVTPWYPSEHSLAAGSFVEHDVLLLERDHEVTVIHLAEAKHLNEGDALDGPAGKKSRVIRIPFDPLNPITLIRAASTIRNYIPLNDLVHTMSLHSLLPVRLANPSLPWVHTEHWSGLILPRLPLKKRLGFLAYRRLLVKPDAVVAVSEALAEGINKQVTRDVSVIPNHVHAGTGAVLPEAASSQSDTPLRLIAVGNLIHHKGPLIALEAISELRGIGIEATLTWIGDGPLKESVEARANDLGLAGQLTLTGQVSHTEISRHLQQAQLFILPTVSETFGVSIAEALSHGLPVVVSGFGGHTAFLPPRASRLMHVRTGQAAADAIRSLLEDRYSWNPEQIRNFAQQKFSTQMRREAYADLYESVR